MTDLSDWPTVAALMRAEAPDWRGVPGLDYCDWEGRHAPHCDCGADEGD